MSGIRRSSCAERRSGLAIEGEEVNRLLHCPERISVLDYLESHIFPAFSTILCSVAAQNFIL